MDDIRETMEKRAKRIVETAMRLAEKGGFAAVRLRDVASEAGVALGTVYKRFQSKEDILVASLELLYPEFRSTVAERAIQNDSKLERMVAFFSVITDWLCERQNFTRALFRAMTSSEPDLAGKIARFHGHIAMMIAAALLGPEKTEGEVETDFTQLEEGEFEMISALMQLWFAAMVGWSGGLCTKEDIIQQVRTAAELFLLGLEVKYGRQVALPEAAPPPAA